MFATAAAPRRRAIATTNSSTAAPPARATQSCSPAGRSPTAALHVQPGASGAASSLARATNLSGPRGPAGETPASLGDPVERLAFVTLALDFCVLERAGMRAVALNETDGRQETAGVQTVGSSRGGSTRLAGASAAERTVSSGATGRRAERPRGRRDRYRRHAAVEAAGPTARRRRRRRRWRRGCSRAGRGGFVAVIVGDHALLDGGGSGGGGGSGLQRVVGGQPGREAALARRR
jgi:hypothetical protein